MKYCAILNADDICTGISQVKTDAKMKNGVVLEKFDISVLGKKYNDGVWEDGYVEETNPPSSEEPSNPEEPTQLDRIEAALSLLTGDSVSESAVTTAIEEGVNDV